MRDPLKVVRVNTEKKAVHTTSRDWTGSGKDQLGYTVVLLLSRSINKREADLLAATDWNLKLSVIRPDASRLSLEDTELEHVEALIPEINTRLTQIEREATQAEIAEEQAQTQKQADQDEEEARRKAILNRINQNLP